MKQPRKRDNAPDNVSRLIYQHRGEDDDISFAAFVSQRLSSYYTDEQRNLILSMPLDSNVGKAIAKEWKLWYACAKAANDEDVVGDLAYTFVRQMSLHVCG